MAFSKRIYLYIALLSFGLFPPFPVIANTGVTLLKASGNQNGTPFVEMALKGGVIEKITINSGRFIESIQFTYRYGKKYVVGQTQGGKGKKKMKGSSSSSFTFRPGEVITEMGGRSGKYVHSLYIVTSMGRKQTWGGKSGKGGRGAFKFTGSKRNPIVGVWGHSSSFINALGAVRIKPDVQVRRRTRDNAARVTDHRRNSSQVRDHRTNADRIRDHRRTPPVVVDRRHTRPPRAAGGSRACSGQFNGGAGFDDFFPKTPEKPKPGSICAENPERCDTQVQGRQFPYPNRSANANELKSWLKDHNDLLIGIVRRVAKSHEDFRKYENGETVQCGSDIYCQIAYRSGAISYGTNAE